MTNAHTDGRLADAAQSTGPSRDSDIVGCTHSNEIVTADGHGSYCGSCGETLS